MQDVPTQNKILRVYRFLKGLQAATLLFYADGRTIVLEEIERSKRKEVRQNICPIIRFVYFWSPVTFIALSFVFVILLGITGSMFDVDVYRDHRPYAHFMTDFDLRWRTYMSVFLLGVCTLLIGSIPVIFFILPKIHAAFNRRFERKLAESLAEAWEKKESAPSEPIGPSAWSLLKAWARAKHDKFCFTFQVVDPMPAE